MSIQRIFSGFGRRGVGNYPALNSRVTVTGGPTDYVGQEGVVLRLRGLGRVSVKLNNGVTASLDAKNLRLTLDAATTGANDNV